MSDEEKAETVTLSGDGRDYHTAEVSLTSSPARSYHAATSSSGFIPYSHFEPTFTPKPPYVLTTIDGENDKAPITRVISRSESQVSGGRCAPVKRVILPLPWQGTNDRCHWSRTNGFCLSICLVVIGVGIFVFASMSEIEAFKKTKNYKEGVCITYETAIFTETQMYFTCPEANCEKSCKDVNFTCNQVFGRLYHSAQNHSRLFQIYATHDDTRFFRGKCSYKPKRQCKFETESYFKEYTELGMEYKCYFSSLRHPIKIVLFKENLEIEYLTVPLSLMGTGVLIFLAVKALGHKCGCPSEAQIKKKEQQELEQFEQLELQPSVSQAS